MGCFSFHNIKWIIVFVNLIWKKKLNVRVVKERQTMFLFWLIKLWLGFFRSVTTVLLLLILVGRIIGSSQRKMQKEEMTNVPRCVTPENKVVPVVESIKEVRKKVKKSIFYF